MITTLNFRASRAVVIGIDAYSGGIPALRTAVADASRVAEVLEADHGYEIRRLTENVGLDCLRRLFAEDLPSEVGVDDRVLVYFAGHGIALDGDDGPAGYLVPQDARRDDRSSFLPMTDLSAWLEALPCRHMLLVLDCCFAGAFRWSSTRDLGAPPQVIYRERFDRFVRAPAWQVITSASHDQKALDVLSGETIGVRGYDADASCHSPFAAAFLRALAGEADVARGKDGLGDGVVTATELYMFLRDAVELGAEGVNHRQTPGFWPLKKHDKGEFIHLVAGHELNLPPAPELTDAANPWRGLRSYDEEQAGLFFGRSRFVAMLVDRVKSQPLTIVLGASGTGKSSVVKAGLLPWLRSQEPDGWSILPPMRPGKSPLTSLAALALPGEPSEPGAVAQRLAVAKLDPEALSLRVSESVASTSPSSQRLLLVVDQFEELITLCVDAAEREQFLLQLDHALAARPDRLRVVLTLRSDFEPQFSHTPLEEDWLASRVVVPVMSLDEYREVIEGPASARVLYFKGHSSTQSFVDRLIGDVANTPGALPLLSFTLSELYRGYLASDSDDRSLCETDYDKLGGVGGSLRNRAEEVHDGLPDDAHRVALRRVMLRMVSVEGGELARRRVLKEEIVYESEDENLRVAEVLRRMDEARLVVSGKDEEDRATFEPAHDELIRGWGRLLEWTRSSLEELEFRRRLTPASREWAAGQGGLWMIEPRLGVLKHVLKQPESWLNAVEARFIQRSLTGRRNAILGTCGAAVALIGLLVVAGLFTARFVRNLPRERLGAARTVLVGLGFRVTDENLDLFKISWNVSPLGQGPLTDDSWRKAAEPLRTLDRYATIESIELVNTDVADLRSLAGLKTVKRLKILASDANDLSPLEGMRQLEALDLENFGFIEADDLKVLRNFKSIGTLYLAGCDHLTNGVTAYLAGLPIRSLTLSDCKEIDNSGLDFLRGLPLEHLTINRTGARVDRRLVDLLLSFPKLRSMSVAGLPVDEVEMGRLRKLGATRNQTINPAPSPPARSPTRHLATQPASPRGPGASLTKQSPSKSPMQHASPVPSTIPPRERSTAP